jgi:hypothetical protein
MKASLMRHFNFKGGIQMKERAILILSISIAILSFFLAAKRNIRRSVVVLLFVQTYTWVTGLMVAENNLIRYPVKLFFRKSYKGSFEYEHIVFPVYCVLFTRYFPSNKGWLPKFLYYSGLTSFITLLEVYAVRKTDAIKLIHWKLWLSALATVITFYFAVIFEKWIFKPYDQTFQPHQQNSNKEENT